MAETTTSVPITEVGFNSISMADEADSTTNSFDSYPMEEMSSINGKEWFTVNLKFPWLSVNVPVVPPLSNTEAAGIASLLSPLLILPETVTDWAKDLFETKKIRRSTNNVFVEVFIKCCFGHRIFTLANKS